MQSISALSKQHESWRHSCSHRAATQIHISLLSNIRVQVVRGSGWRASVFREEASMWATSCQGAHSLGMKPCPSCLSLHQLGVYLRELHTTQTS